MAQDITLLGASYSAVPAVMLPKTGGGNALFADPSPVTAVAADVTQGKIFIDSDGNLVEGTGTVGSDVLPTTVILPEQTVTVSAENTSLSGFTQPIVTGDVYLLTVNGESKITTATEVYGGASAIFIYYVRFESYGNNMYLSVYDSSLYGTYTVKVEKVLSLDYATLTTKSITQNGTYSAEDDDADGYSEVTVNVSSGTSKNTQVVQGTTRTTSSSLTAIGAELTVSKTGTYDIYWSGIRTNTSASYTFATQLYIDGTAYGSENSTWTNHVQNNHLTNVSLTSGQKLRVYGRESRGSSYYMYAPTLVIVEA